MTDPVSDPLRDPRCLATPEALLIDGANGVCRAPRLAPRTLHAGDLVAAGTVALLVGLAVAALHARRSRLPLALAMLAVLAAAVPGYLAMLTQRADQPTRVLATSASTARLERDLERFSSAHHGCVAVTHDACVACAPVLRFATATQPRCPRPRAAIELYPDTLATGCAQTAGLLRCGTAPAPRTP